MISRGYIQIKEINSFLWFWGVTDHSPKCPDKRISDGSAMSNPKIAQKQRKKASSGIESINKLSRNNCQVNRAKVGDAKTNKGRCKSVLQQGE
jgi:hypothetical protein